MFSTTPLGCCSSSRCCVGTAMREWNLCWRADLSTLRGVDRPAPDLLGPHLASISDIERPASRASSCLAGAAPDDRHRQPDAGPSPLRQLAGARTAAGGAAAGRAGGDVDI